MASGDFNRDGKLDLAVANELTIPATVSVLLNTGPTNGTPMVSLSPASLTFPVHLVGSSTPSKPVTLTNTGTAALLITSITITGTNSADFTQTNTCGSNVAPGASCTINVSFAPTAAGSRSAALTITDNAAGSPHSVPLSGTGTIVKLLPANLNFGNQQVGTMSSPKMVTLTNLGTVTLNITTVKITGSNAGDFSQTNTCGSTVAPGASCTISVTFKPKAVGTRSGSVSVSDDGGGSPQKVTLSGTGT